MTDFTQILGIIASILSSILFLPQLFHMIKLKSGKDVSYIFLFLQILSSILWIIYGYLIISFPLIFGDSIMLSITIIMSLIKYYYSINDNSENL